MRFPLTVFAAAAAAPASAHVCVCVAPFLGRQSFHLWVPSLDAPAAVVPQLLPWATYVLFRRSVLMTDP